MKISEPPRFQGSAVTGSSSFEKDTTWVLGSTPVPFYSVKEPPGISRSLPCHPPASKQGHEVADQSGERGWVRGFDSLHPKPQAIILEIFAGSYTKPF